MQLEAGKFYTNGDGQKVGPMRLTQCNDGFHWSDPNSVNYFTDAGQCDDGQIYGLIAEWTDTPTIWENMTPEQKGALLLAEFEGEAIEVIDPKEPGDKWCVILDVRFDSPNMAYRIKPEPKRETMTLHGRMHISNAYPEGVFNANRNPLRAGDTHRITFDTIDGEPDCATIRMERLT